MSILLHILIPLKTEKKIHILSNSKLTWILIFQLPCERGFFYSTYLEVISNEVVLFGDFTMILLRHDVKKKLFSFYRAKLLIENMFV